MKEHFRKYCEDEALRWPHMLGLLAYDPLPAEVRAKQLNIPIWGQEEILKYGKDLYEMLLVKEEKSSWSGSVLVLPGGKHLLCLHSKVESRYKSFRSRVLPLYNESKTERQQEIFGGLCRQSAGI